MKHDTNLVKINSNHLYRSDALRWVDHFFGKDAVQEAAIKGEIQHLMADDWVWVQGSWLLSWLASKSIRLRPTPTSPKGPAKKPTKKKGGKN